MVGKKFNERGMYMKRYFKRPLAFVMAAAISASMIPSVALAADTTHTDHTYQKLSQATIEVVDNGNGSYTFTATEKCDNCDSIRTAGSVTTTLTEVSKAATCQNDKEIKYVGTIKDEITGESRTVWSDPVVQTGTKLNHNVKEATVYENANLCNVKVDSITYKYCTLCNKVLSKDGKTQTDIAAPGKDTTDASLFNQVKAQNYDVVSATSQHQAGDTTYYRVEKSDGTTAEYKTEDAAKSAAEDYAKKTPSWAKVYSYKTCKNCGEELEKTLVAYVCGHDKTTVEDEVVANCKADQTKYIYTVCKDCMANAEAENRDVVYPTYVDGKKVYKVAPFSTAITKVNYTDIAGVYVSVESKTIAKHKVDLTDNDLSVGTDGKTISLTRVKGHDGEFTFIEKGATVASTCTTKGTQEYIFKCETCGEQFALTQTLALAQHQPKTTDLTDEQVSAYAAANKGKFTAETTTAATCTKSGTKYQASVCSVCGQIVSVPQLVNVPALGHKQVVADVTVADIAAGTYPAQYAPYDATCDKDGYHYTVTTCERGDLKAQFTKVVDAKTNHKNAYYKVRWTEDKEGNTVAKYTDNVATYTIEKWCPDCQTWLDTKDNAYKGTFYAVASDETVSKYECVASTKTFKADKTIAGVQYTDELVVKSTPTADHDYDVPTAVTTKEATCGATGLYNLVKTCKVCGDQVVVTKDLVLPATGKHTYVDGKCTVCGAADPDAVPSVDPTSITSITKTKKTLTVNVADVEGATGYQYKVWKKGKVGTTSKYYYDSYSHKKIRGLSKNTTYGVKVRAYVRVGNTNYYSTWSAIQYVKTKK